MSSLMKSNYRRLNQVNMLKKRRREKMHYNLIYSVGINLFTLVNLVYSPGFTLFINSC